MILSLRAMGSDDLSLVEAWLADPEVARWFLAGSTIEAEIEELRRCVMGDEPTEALILVERNRPIGWCQWYLCQNYPEHAVGVGAGPADVGIDYAIGEPGRRGRGQGTVLIGLLVTYIRGRHPDAAVFADPEASNVASRRVLENNGFRLLAERPLPSEPTQSIMAIYRLLPTAVTSR